jgi:hypothetical protein
MLKYDGQKYKISARFASCEQKYDALKFDEWHYFDAPVFPCGHFFGPVGDDEQIFAILFNNYAVLNKKVQILFNTGLLLVIYANILSLDERGVHPCRGEMYLARPRPYVANSSARAGRMHPAPTWDGAAC